MGGLAGAVLASPQVQAIVVRFISNNTDQSLTMTNPPGSEDLCFELTLGKGAAFVPSATYSLDKGDWLLTEPEDGEDGGERLIMWERTELTNGKSGVVEETWSMQPYLDEPVELKETKKLVPFGKRNDVAKKLETVGENNRASPSPPPAPLAGVELVCTSKIRVGQQVLSTTVRTYRTVQHVEGASSEDEDEEAEGPEEDASNPLIRATFEDEGPIGILWRNVVRTTDDAQLAIAEKITPDSPASKRRLTPGVILTAVNGTRTTTMPFDYQIKLIQESSRPVTMVFRRPRMYESVDVPEPEEQGPESMSMSTCSS